MASLAALLFSGKALARGDEPEIRHGPYFNYLWSTVKGPTFDGSHFDDTRGTASSGDYARGYYVNQSASTTGFEAGYKVGIGVPMGPGIDFALDYARWAPARLRDFTVTIPSGVVNTYSNASVSYAVVDLLVSFDLLVGAVYGGLGMGKRSMSFTFQQRRYDDWEVAGNWVFGLKVSPIAPTLALITRDARVVGWARTFDISGMVEWRYVQGGVHCEGVAYTDHCGGTEVTETSDAHIRSMGLGLTIDLGTFFGQRWEHWGNDHYWFKD